LCTSSVNSPDSLLVFSKVIACLQYGHFAICYSLISVMSDLTISKLLTDGGYLNSSILYGRRFD
jgi:proteasome assembly chaperone (PAC2) family protein